MNQKVFKVEVDDGITLSYYIVFAQTEEEARTHFCGKVYLDISELTQGSNYIAHTRSYSN